MTHALDRRGFLAGLFGAVAASALPMPAKPFSLAGTLSVGDVITIDGLRSSTGALRQFRVTAVVPERATFNEVF